MGATENEFYLTIPNWSSEDFYHNSQSDFRVQLPQMMSLYGEWSVGLSQILYHQTWYNVQKNFNEIEIEFNGSSHTLPITEGYYYLEADLINEINRCIHSVFPEIQLLFKFNRFNNKCSVLMHGENVKILLHHKLADILGLPISIDDSLEGDKPINVSVNTQSIYIYCDIIDEQIIGGKKWKLLKFLPIEPKRFGEVITKDFDTPQYLPVKTKHFQTIHIKICNQETDIINFTRGISILQLHFKLTRIPIFY